MSSGDPKGESLGSIGNNVEDILQSYNSNIQTLTFDFLLSDFFFVPWFKIGNNH